MFYSSSPLYCVESIKSKLVFLIIIYLDNAHFKIFIVCDKRSFGITGEGGPKGDTLVYEQLNTL